MWEAAQLYETILNANDRYFASVYRLGLKFGRPPAHL